MDNHQKEKLQTVFSRLNPRIPAGSGDAALQRIPRDENITEDLIIQLGSDEKSKVLLSGHIGVGKSTELLYLAEQMKEDRFIVQCSISRVFGVAHSLDIFSLLIIILHTLIKNWQVQLKQFPKGLLERLAKYHINKNFFDNDPDIKTEKQLLNYYSTVLKEITLQPPQFKLNSLQYVSNMERSCSIVLNALADAVEKPVLLIMDDLDKIRDHSSQTDIFLNHANTWSGLPCSIAATVPLEIIYSSAGRELDDFWGNATLLNPLPVPELNMYDQKSEKFDFYYDLLKSADALSLFEPHYNCLKLAAISGGLPRSFVNACADCVKNAIKNNSPIIEDSHIKAYELQHLNKWRGRLNDEDYEALTNVLSSGGSNLNNLQALRLLRDGILLKDDNAPEDRQIRLASWAWPLLEVYCRRKGKHITDLRLGQPRSAGTVYR